MAKKSKKDSENVIVWPPASSPIGRKMTKKWVGPGIKRTLGFWVKAKMRKNR
jgi:hypothetical protein